MMMLSTTNELRKKNFIFQNLLNVTTGMVWLARSGDLSLVKSVIYITRFGMVGLGGRLVTSKIGRLGTSTIYFDNAL